MPKPGITLKQRWPGVYQVFSPFNKSLNYWIKFGDGEDGDRKRYHFDFDRKLHLIKSWYIPEERVGDLQAWAEEHGYEFAEVQMKEIFVGSDLLEFPDDLTPWQEQGILRALGQKVLLAQWITGAGKSRFAIELYNFLRRQRPEDKAPKALIVCPKVVMRTWETEQLPRWLPETETGTDDPGPGPLVWSLIQGRKLDRPQPDIVIVSYGSLHKVPKHWKFDLIVYDELHYGIHGGSGRSQRAVELSYQNESAIRVGLTATPTSASLTDLWSQLNILCPHRWGSFNSWWRYFFTEVPVGYEDYTKPGGVQSERLAELIQSLDSVCHYVSHEEVGDALPPVKWEQATLGGGKERGEHPTPPESIKQWRQENILTAPDRARAFGEFWQGKLAENPSQPRTAIITYHRTLAEDVAQKIGAEYVSGELTPKQRHATLADADIAVMTMRSVTEGLDLRAYTQVFILEAYPVPLYLTQVLGRFVRLFAEDPVNITFLRLKGSSDDIIVHRLLGRMEAQSKLLRQGKTEKGLKNLLTLDENSEDFLAELRAACNNMHDDDEAGEDPWAFDWDDEEGD